jgi:hypothetical protein
MPIRFRCPYCNQLLGIARRKGGTQVACPTCQRQVNVPTEEPAAAPASLPVPEPIHEPAAAPALFERDDFDMLLRPQASMAGEPARPAPAPARTPVPATRPQPPPPPPLIEPAPIWTEAPQPLAAGLVLSPTKATILTVAVILLLAVAFGAGLLVGRFYL